MAPRLFKRFTHGAQRHQHTPKESYFTIARIAAPSHILWLELNCDWNFPGEIAGPLIMPARRGRNPLKARHRL